MVVGDNSDNQIFFIPMSLDKLNKLSKNVHKSYYAGSTPTNTKPKPEPVAPPIDIPDSILKKDTYFLGRIKELETELYLLKHDMLSIIDFVNGELDVAYTAQSLREKLRDFRAWEQHALRRIANKTEALNKYDLHLDLDNEPEPGDEPKTDV